MNTDRMHTRSVGQIMKRIVHLHSTWTESITKNAWNKHAARQHMKPQQWTEIATANTGLEWSNSGYYLYHLSITEFIYIFSASLIINRSNKMVFAMRPSVLRLEFIVIFRWNLHFKGRFMPQADSRRSLTAGIQVRFRITPCDILWWIKWHWDRIYFSEYFGFSLAVSCCWCSVITFILILLFVWTTSGCSLLGFKHRSALWDIGEHWAVKYCHILHFFFCVTSKERRPLFF